MGLTLGHGAWQIDRPSNGSMWNSYSFQPIGQWMGYSFTDLEAEGCCRSLNALFVFVFNASTFRHWKHYVFSLSVHLSFHPFILPPIWLTITQMTDQPTFHQSVSPERFQHIFWRMYGRSNLKFGMLMYPDHLQKWLDFVYGLLIFQGVGGAVRFLVVGTIVQEERPPQGQLWMEQCLTLLKYWPI